ncbi:MAG: hypothetical protein JWN94_4879 [Betaproteobacteria bacterium]|jgi:hypothetical protein|nr:hypothetical protein [Betaproteobacteria bacterium]
MGAAIHFVQGLPIVLMALTIVVAVVAVGWLLVSLVGRFSSARLRKAYLDLPPVLCGALMAGQAILCAVLMSSVWKDLGSAHQSVLQEARALSFAAKLVDEKSNPEWRPAITAYARAIVQREWESMSKGAEDAEARTTLDRMHTMVINGWPGQSASLRSALGTALQEIEVARQNRLMAAIDFIPDEVWLSVVISALAVLAFSSMLLSHVPGTARITVTMYGIVIGIMWFSVIAVDRPFTGKISVSNAPIARLATPP